MGESGCNINDIQIELHLQNSENFFFLNVTLLPVHKTLTEKTAEDELFNEHAIALHLFLNKVLEFTLLFLVHFFIPAITIITAIITVT